MTSCRTLTDHPRVCGEKSSGSTPQLSIGGSPPRVRGEVILEAVRRPDSRITPACAGRRLKRSPI